MQILDVLAGHGIYAYVARTYRRTMVSGEARMKLRNLLPGMLFAYLSSHDFEAIFRKKDDAPESLYRQLSFASYCYDPSYRTAGLKPSPLIIPASEMQSFILATSTHDENILVLPDSWQPRGRMDVVEVVRGRFKGVRGQMMINAAGLKYIVVTLPGLTAIRLPHLHTKDVKYFSYDE